MFLLLYYVLNAKHRIFPLWFHLKQSPALLHGLGLARNGPIGIILQCESRQFFENLHLFSQCEMSSVHTGVC